MLPKSIRFYCITALFLVLSMSLMRLVFYYAFRDTGGNPPMEDVFRSLYLGLKFDLRLAVWLHLPLLILLLLPWLNPFNNRLARAVCFSWLTASFTALALLYIVDFGNFSYLEMRVDASFLRFLKNPAISAQMVVESYPVARLSFLLVAAVAMHFIGYRWIFGVLSRQRYSKRDTRIRAASIVLVVFAAALAVYGKFSWYPLRWSEAFFSNNDFVSALALNPALFLAQTFKNRQIDFDAGAVGRAYDDMALFLGVDNPDQKALDFLRKEGRTDRLRPNTNVVLVILESFAFYKAGLSGNPLNPTPFFDRLAEDGVLFRRFYTPHGGTARSVFTAVTGLPDVELNQTSTRNPLVIDQHTIIEEFDGYRKLYFLGGSASWGQIRGLLARNIQGLKIFEEGSYQAPRVDAWGLSDLDLFQEALSVLSHQPEPFFSIIQTAGNHKPYTIPDNIPGFEKVSVPEEEAVRYGFRSQAALNSYRFMDFSLNEFMEQARQQPFFDNTLFVFFGDHGLIRSADHMFPAEEKLLLTRGHVPLLFYAPGQLDPEVVDKVAGEVDLLPTIAGLVLDQYRNTTMGRDLFDSGFDSERYAFTIRHQYGPQIGLIGNEHVFRMRVDGAARGLFKIHSPSPDVNLLDRFPQQAEKMEKLTRDYYETVKYMRYHNGALSK